MGEIVYQAPEISMEEYKKYRGKHVAIFKGKIVASGTTAKEALTNALKKNPNAKTSQIALHYICPAEELILSSDTHSNTLQSSQGEASFTDP